VSTIYGPQEASWDDVQAAHTACWDAVEKSGFGSPESIEAFDLAAAAHHSLVRGGGRQAAGHEAETEVGQ